MAARRLRRELSLQGVPTLSLQQLQETAPLVYREHRRASRLVRYLLEPKPPGEGLSALAAALEEQVRAMADVLTGSLWRAIVLREATRRALDRDDMQAVRLWNRWADRAYAALDPFEAAAYMQWVRSDERDIVLNAATK